MILVSNIEQMNKRIIGRRGKMAYVTLPVGWGKPGEQVLVIEQDKDTLVITKNKTVQMEG